MSFTQRTVTHQFENPDGTPGAGSVEFTLLKQMTNSGVTILPGSVTFSIASDGTLSATVTPNNDTGTFPDDAQYEITIRLQAQGAAAIPFVATIPAGSGSVDLGSLIPEETQPN